MYRQILIPSSNHLVLHIPDNLVGHKVEVIAFSVDEAKKTDDKYSWKNALKFFRKNQVSFKDFKFNREEANER